MNTEDFEFLTSFIRKKSGLVLDDDKRYLLESRLGPVARKKGCAGLDGLVAELRARDTALEVEVIEAMTTNESFFFRDQRPFDQFRFVVLPNLLKTRAEKKSFRIWCAAASSGQEPYSLAMILKEEAAKLAGWRVEIIGTDLSGEIIKKAEKGFYSQFEVQRGLPIQLLLKYFIKRDDQWELDPAVRSMVQYKVGNLLQELSGLGTFDIVFCRNVLIYFDQETKNSVMRNIKSRMANDGVLYLGGAETMIGAERNFQLVKGQCGLYVKAECSDGGLGAAG